MAKSEAERKAYAKQYYQEYTKKGKKKGRKKGSKRKSSSKSLLGLSTSGLSPEGKMQAALIKEDFKKQMNEALSKATTDEEKKQIRLDYSRKALAEIDKLKSDPKNVKTKAVKTPKQKSSSGSSKSSKSSESSKSKSKSTAVKTAKTAKTANAVKTTEEPVVDIEKASLTQITDMVSKLSQSLSKLTEEQKTVVRNQISDILDILKKRLAGAVNG